MTLIHSKAFKQGISFGVVSSTMTVLGVSLGTWASGGKIAALIATILGLSISNSLQMHFQYIWLILQQVMLILLYHLH